MDVAATMTSKGQVTVPKAVREALDLRAGDDVIFRVENGRATLAKVADFLDLAGTIPVPANRRNVGWDEIIAQTHSERGARAR